MDFKIDIKTLSILTIVFILFTAIGTVSHEYGHIVVAKMYGYETSLSHASMDYYPEGYLQDKDLKALKSLAKSYENSDYDSWPKESKVKVKEYNSVLQKRYWNEKSNNKRLFITIGGPLQTVLTGSIGFIVLMTRRSSIQLQGLKILDWSAVFLSLFWLREPFNLIASIGGEMISPNGNWFGGDELHISQGLNIWSGTIPIILATIGLILSIYIVFFILPKKIRLTFILSGLFGGISGYILWMHLIGPKVLP